jgi:hypothetical protein
VVLNDKIRVGEKILICVTAVHKDTKFCVRCGESQISSFAPQIRRQRNVARVPTYFIIL